MKTIVVGTDSYSSSKNAAIYAAMLADKTASKHALFNLVEVLRMHGNSDLFLIETILIAMDIEEKSRFYKSIYGSRGIDIADKLNSAVIIVPHCYKLHKAEPYCKNHQIDSMGISSKEHSVFYDFFAESVTGKIAFN